MDEKAHYLCLFSNNMVEAEEARLEVAYDHHYSWMMRDYCIISDLLRIRNLLQIKM